ncbi:SDR family oxidoreductase [Roseibium sp. CAU 1637]|uniref:SDR family oxidoreductase n=1 Tax=Roseibium limicola TaxID=2816037 RepID=A0A939EL13_9HYPH|nr:SDR family oxidoreductase [Roseibium limicola]MBO0343816.1 SDR family oxidoreductase [Roseibium limicola]
MSSSSVTAVLTGASSRIGKVIAEDLAAHGWRLVLHAHKGSDRVERLAHQIKADGGDCLIQIADLTDVDALTSFMDVTTAKFGPADVLINNASIFEDDSLGSLNPTLFDQHFAIHTRAPVFLSEGLARHLPTDRRGLVVNLIDQRVWKPTPQALSYSLSKAALWDATQRMAQALAPAVRVNAIGPGPSFKNERQSDVEFDKQSRSVLLQSGPSPSEFGQTIRYFWASTSVTGQMIALDGGQHLAWRTPDVTDVGE